MKLTAQNIAVIEGDAYLSQDIINAGRLDVARDYLLQFRKYIPEGGAVIDAGACLGDYTATFSEFVGDTGRVHAFEPNPEVFECLLHNTLGYPNVYSFCVALGNTRGMKHINKDSHNIGASYLSETVGPRVKVRKLDVFFQSWLSRLDFLKLDTEGYEPYVLDGARETIQRLRPVILVEIDQRALGLQGFTPKGVHERLDSLGYEFERFDGAHGNVLCLPK